MNWEDAAEDSQPFSHMSDVIRRMAFVIFCAFWGAGCSGRIWTADLSFLPADFWNHFYGRHGSAGEPLPPLREARGRDGPTGRRDGPSGQMPGTSKTLRCGRRTRRSASPRNRQRKPQTEVRMPIACKCHMMSYANVAHGKSPAQAIHFTDVLADLLDWLHGPRFWDLGLRPCRQCTWLVLQTSRAVARPRLVGVRRLLQHDALLAFGADMAMVQNQWYHFGIGAPPILVYFSGDWDVHCGGRVVTHGHVAGLPG